VFEWLVTGILELLAWAHESEDRPEARRMVRGCMTVFIILLALAAIVYLLW
jgi:hypothetical protein